MAAEKRRIPRTAEENHARLFRTSILMNFVKKHDGHWNHEQWEELLNRLETGGYFPIEIDTVGLKLEEKKAKYLAGK